MTEKNIVNVLTKELLKLGFIVHRYDAITTSSIYLKLDYGVCCGIRISNHNGKAKYHYRFNVIKNYKGDKITQYESLVSYFYNFEELPQLLLKIKEEKQSKIQKYGLENYQKYMKIEAKKELYKRFKNIKIKE